MEQEYQEQATKWRTQLEAKAEEFEEMMQSQGQGGPNRELEMMRLKLAEELEEPFKARVTQLEARLASETRKAQDCRREVEVMKIQAAQQEGEHDHALKEERER